jgi:hypothetical protein
MDHRSPHKGGPSLMDRRSPHKGGRSLTDRRSPHRGSLQSNHAVYTLTTVIRNRNNSSSQCGALIRTRLGGRRLRPWRLREVLWDVAETRGVLCTGKPKRLQSRDTLCFKDRPYVVNIQYVRANEMLRG